MLAGTEMCNLVILTNFIPPYRIPVFAALARRVSDIRILISTNMEQNRRWAVDTHDLPIIRQHSVSFRLRQYHGAISTESILHLPYDTIYWLRRLRPRVILTGEMGARTIQAMLYKHLFDRRVKVIVHADVSEWTEQNRGTVRVQVRRWIVRHADAIIVNGQSGKRYLQSIGGAERKLFIVPYTTNISSFLDIKPRGISDRFRILYVGQLISLKGLRPFAEVLVQWAATHPERRVSWRLVGDGPLRRELEGMSTPNNLQIEVMGFVPYKNLPSVYADADIFVFPTTADTWGLVVNEALASGVPVLGSLRSQAVEELVEDGVNGWTFWPTNTEEMYGTLERAMDTPQDKLLQMRRAAQERISSLTPEAVADRIWRVIDTCRGLS